MIWKEGKLREKAAKKKWSLAVAETFEKEVRKLERLHPQSPDFSIQTQYVQRLSICHGTNTARIIQSCPCTESLGSRSLRVGEGERAHH